MNMFATSVSVTTENSVSVTTENSECPNRRTVPRGEGDRRSRCLTGGGGESEPLVEGLGFGVWSAAPAV